MMPRLNDHELEQLNKKKDSFKSFFLLNVVYYKHFFYNFMIKLKKNHVKICKNDFLKL